MSLMEEYDPLKGKRLEILQPDGTLKQGLKAPIDDQTTFTLYRQILLTRLADQRCLSLQRQGRFGPTCPSGGRRPARLEAPICFKKETVFFLPSARSAPR